MKHLGTGIVLGILFIGSICGAHQPRVTNDVHTIVEDPEISKAYYKILDGSVHTYAIESNKAFDLYVNILVPDQENQPTDLVVSITEELSNETIATLDGPSYERGTFFELFGYDNYLQGPEYSEIVEPGSYLITVSSENNDSKYSLAIGEIEAFDFAETINAYKSIPEIKRTFFETSPITFLFSPLGRGLVLVMFLLSFLFGFFYRRVLKTIERKSPSPPIRSSKNIPLSGRFLRAGCGLVLFFLAITTSRNPLLLFCSGFCFFEALFSRCGFYAAIGKNSCPM